MQITTIGLDLAKQIFLSRCAQAGQRMRAVIPSFDLT